MPTYSIWMQASNSITVSGGGSLSGITQGDGSHLVGRTITFVGRDVVETRILDNDANFDDNDSTQQTLDGAQTIGGTTYASGTKVEAEYTVVLRDPATGQTYQAIGYNINNSNPTYATIEGLAFIGGRGGFPPPNTALTVISATEGPGSTGQAATSSASYSSPACLTPGTAVDVPGGTRAAETLRPGDLVLTRDHGPQPLRWTGSATQDGPHATGFHPVLIPAHAFGPSCPARDLLVSPQHRILIEGWSCALHFGEDEVLVPAAALIGQNGITRTHPSGALTYLHLMFERHEIIRTEGAWTESFHIAAAANPCVAIGPAQRAELIRMFPSLARGHAPAIATARRVLKSWEAQVLAA